MIWVSFFCLTKRYWSNSKMTSMSYNLRLRSSFLSTLIEFLSQIIDLEGKVKKYRPIRGWANILFFFSIGTNLIKDIDILLSAMFRWFKSTSRNCLSKSEARAATFFSIGPEKANFEEDVEIFLPVTFC